MITREARPDDWPAVWRFLSIVLAAGDTYTTPRDVTSDEARAEWLAPPPNDATVAVTEDGAVVGIAKVRPNLPGAGSHVANASFVVDPEVSARGTGRLLGEAVLDRARDLGYSAMQFNAVVETNTRAVRLWESLGFAIIGTVPRAFRHPSEGDVGLHVMHRAL